MGACILYCYCSYSPCAPFTHIFSQTTENAALRQTSKS